MEGEVVTLQEIFTYEQHGIDEQGRYKGKFRATGIRPKFMERLEGMGITIAADIFNPTKVYEC